MKLYVPIFSLTLLLSATLLFVVQPMFSKMILPLVGGSPQVWNTAMLFFQVCLLAGYAYAHGTTKFLSIRVQAVLHVLLIVLFAFVLPFSIPSGWYPPEGGDPTLWQLTVMATTVGGPFFILSGSAPMFQRWFSHSGHKDADNPYFLYGASNLGSMSSLLLYPILIEPFLTLHTQAATWAFGYGLLGLATACCAALVWNKSSHAVKENDTEVSEDKITNGRRLKWIILSFIPSSLMLGVTTYITTDIASVPLLWVLPLAIYIGTFIIVFARNQIVTLPQLTTAFGISIIALALNEMSLIHIFDMPFFTIALHFIVFFLAATMCHLALAQSRPAAKNLTEFYLIMSFGGALGGFFNAIIVPNVFIVPIEYQLVLLMAVLVRYQDNVTHGFKTVIEAIKASPKEVFTIEKIMLLVIIISIGVSTVVAKSNDTLFLGIAGAVSIALLFLLRTRWAFLLAITPILLTNQIYLPSDVLYQDRNFFGVMRIVQDTNERFLMHGTTNHGTQPTIEGYELEQTSYYSQQSPVRDAFGIFNAQDGDQEVAVIGIGIGVLTCQQKDGRHFDLYEIDKDIADIAENEEYFYYLKRCGSPYDIMLGDGRIRMQKQPDQKYDLIIGDAFSSDSIPIHLMTKEAIEIYLNKIKDDGLITIHISNRYLDIEPVVTLIGKELGVYVYAKATLGAPVGDTEIEGYDSHYISITKSKKIVEQLKAQGWSEGRTREGVKMWTDDFSNIISVFDTKIQRERLKEQCVSWKTVKENGTDLYEETLINHFLVKCYGTSEVTEK